MFRIAIAMFCAVPLFGAEFTDTWCVSCHNDKVKSGGLSFQGIGSPERGEHAETWERAVRRLRARSMPPQGAKRPSEAEYKTELATLESSLDRAASAKPNPGRTDTFRRLNRTEYHNAIRDLLALDIDANALLPSDDSSHGFDNVTVGELSPTLLERYLSAAQKISRLALGRPIRAPHTETILLPPDLTQEEHFDNLPVGTRGGTSVDYLFPLNGEYEIQLRLARDRNEHVEGLSGTHQLELSIDGERVQLFTVQPPPRGTDHSNVDRDLHLRIPVKAGTHSLTAAFVKKTSVLLETERQPYQAHFNMDRHPRIQPALYSVAINGPFNPTGAGQTASRERILVCSAEKPAAEESCAKRIFLNLARQAWRRPVTESDIQKPLRFYREARAGGDFDAGIEMGLRAILVNPQFLFRIEQDPAGIAPGTAYRLSDIELASRLSFFLWSSIPDEPLLAAAARGELKKPAVLEAQVRRMLADPRADALTTNFAEQWLYLRNLASSSPDARLFPDFDDNLRQSFRKETELFFTSILREDRSVLDLLRANYSFMNERLARHYSIPNVYGSRFRRVTFGENDVRGGLLGQGSILTVTSYATRTSPVIRGKWVLANLLGSPPPPPPPNVPPLKEKAAGTKILSIRERMAEHRDNPVCSGCHKLMDPVGFAFENFDAVGRWRNADNGLAIDSAGNLPDGTPFEGLSGLKKALLSRPDVFANTASEKLMTYALGRGIEYYDAPAIRTIVKDAAARDYKLSDLILGVVKSTPFEMRRSQ